MFLADVIMLVHAVWVLFNLTGFFWARRWPVLGKIHVGTLGLTLGFFLFLGGCPATRWEWQIRQKAHPGISYEGGFVTHYFASAGITKIPDAAVGYITLGLFLLSAYLHFLRPRKSKKT